MIDNDPAPVDGDSARLPLGTGERLSALRIIDANFNRASEGLRVVEEYCRFVLGDRHLTERCKQLRHDLAAALAAITAEQLHAARETQTDVGTDVSAPSEAHRSSLAQILAANWQRIGQALRAIEEYAKLLGPKLAAQFEGLRYVAYTLAKACTIALASRERLTDARLYVLLDGRKSECEFVERAQELIAAGVHVLQLRDKRLNDRTLLARARLLRRVIDDAARQEPRPPTTHHSPLTTHLPLFILNDRPDIAVLSGADGVHVGQDELTVHEVRQIVGPDLVVGVSTHSLEQARQAVLDGANYIGCGPTFQSGTKQFDHFPGLDFIRQVAAEISLPAFAIGGIMRENLPQVLAAGFTRAAIGGALATHSDAGEEARLLLALLQPKA